MCENPDIKMTMLQHDAEMAANREAEKRKPILCLDFDGVLHSYSSGWKGPRNIPDPPVEGALDFLRQAVQVFNVCIFSSRGRYIGGRRAMKACLWKHLAAEYGTEASNGHFVFCAEDIYYKIKWPRGKPPAHASIDDRGFQFNGTFPAIEVLKEFKPWNKR